ncbi:MAG: hypothetical protein KJ592_04820 [Nanoarchaeota archaeon]|nr:hypothetical protein [Nanoarchaeota archaeon]
MNNKAQSEFHIIVGIIFIVGGLLYTIDQNGIGSVFIALGVFTELLYKWLITIIK